MRTATDRVIPRSKGPVTDPMMTMRRERRDTGEEIVAASDLPPRPPFILVVGAAVTMRGAPAGQDLVVGMYSERDPLLRRPVLGTVVGAGDWWTTETAPQLLRTSFVVFFSFLDLPFLLLQVHIQLFYRDR